MKTKHFFLAVALCFATFLNAQWTNEEGYSNYPLNGFTFALASGFHLKGDSLLVFSNIDEYGIGHDGTLACMGIYSPHTGALRDVVILPVSDTLSTGYDNNFWHPTSFGLLNQRSKSIAGTGVSELEFYDYGLNKYAGIPSFSFNAFTEADSNLIAFYRDTLFRINKNGTHRVISPVQHLADSVMRIIADTNYNIGFNNIISSIGHSIYLGCYLYPKNSTNLLDVTYWFELDTLGDILDFRAFPQGGLITANKAGLFALDWYKDTAGVVFNILRGNSLDSLYHAYTIPQYYIEWLYTTPSYMWNIHIKEKAGHVSLVIYENYIDTASTNDWRRTRAILYDPMGNEVYNLIVEGTWYKTDNITRFTVLDDSLNCYVLMEDLSRYMLFLAKIGPDGSLGHNETGYGASHSGLEISPNPAQGHIAVQHGLPGKVRYKVYNTAGKVFLNGNIPVNSKIDIETLAAGNYWLLVFDGASMLQPKPFVKE